MFCSNCGAKIDDSSRFCDMCGVPVEPVVAPPSESEAVPDEVRPVEISDASDDASAADAAAGAVTAAAASVDTTPAGAAPVDTTSAGAAAVDSATAAEPVYAAPEPAPGYGPVDTAPVYGQPAAGSDPYGYSQPSYGQPSYQNYAAQPEVPYSGFAIAGLVTGILGFGIIALILSIMGKKECDEQGKRGRTMAVVGIVLSIITMVLSLIGTIIVFVFLFMAPRYL